MLNVTIRAEGRFRKVGKRGIWQFFCKRKFFKDLELWPQFRVGKRGTGGTISDVHGISMVWFVMIGDFQGRGNFPCVPGHPAGNASFFSRIIDGVEQLYARAVV
jgi:hypothetical protein